MSGTDGPAGPGEGAPEEAGPRWYVEGDRGVCIGSGMCVATAPGGFELDAARQSHPVRPECAASDDVLAAAEGCPVEAISVTDARTGEAVFPPEE
ncbi:ferredoxin [Streptomyces rimosus]|uniref:ferredoxin n=1 Tax=Streptomyces rimosus TaxID=1927 RepID=UPI0004D6F596|nr:ferredoxin [Streptomyces rimosus]KEF07526.1 ferredoxin [Streptomyces rimosus]